MSTAPAVGHLHGTRYGTVGPRVVLLHGLFGQGRNFTALARSLAPDAQVLLLDLPDHGRSPWSDAISYPAMAAAVARELADGAGPEDGPWAVVGHSMGGKVAMALALLRPELVARLGVVDIAPAASGGVDRFGTYAAAMRSLDLESLPDRASADRELAAAVPDATVRAFLLQNLRRDGDRWRWQVNLGLLGDALDVIGGWPDLTAPPYHGRPYRGPVLWVAGQDSDYVRPEHAAAMRALFPRVRTVTVKDAGHWVHADQPAVFAAVLRRFLHL